MSRKHPNLGPKADDRVRVCRDCRPFPSLMVILSAILVGKNVLMALMESLKTCSLSGKELSDNEISAFKDSLCSKTLDRDKSFAESF